MKSFCFLCLIVIMCGFILTVVNAQENQKHQDDAELAINKIENRLPEIEHEQQALKGQLQQEIDTDFRHELEEKFVNLAVEEYSLIRRLANLTMKKPATEEPIEMRKDWYRKRIEYFGGAINHLHEILEIIQIPEFKHKMEGKIRNLEDRKNGLEEELRTIEKLEHRDDKPEIDEPEGNGLFWDNFKHPAVIAAIISAIAIIVAALLKRK